MAKRVATDGGAYMRELDAELAKDPERRRRVDALMDQMRVAQQLVALREERGFSQVKLAQLLGVTQPFIAKLESGRAANIELKTLAKWAVALGASLEISLKTTPRAAKHDRKTKKTVAA